MVPDAALTAAPAAFSLSNNCISGAATESLVIV